MQTFPFEYLLISAYTDTDTSVMSQYQLMTRGLAMFTLATHAHTHALAVRLPEASPVT